MKAYVLKCKDMTLEEGVEALRKGKGIRDDYAFLWLTPSPIVGDKCFKPIKLDDKRIYFVFPNIMWDYTTTLLMFEADAETVREAVNKAAALMFEHKEKYHKEWSAWEYAPMYKEALLHQKGLQASKKTWLQRQLLRIQEYVYRRIGITRE